MSAQITLQNLTSKEEEQLKQAIHLLAEIPQMHFILNNLPDELIITKTNFPYPAYFRNENIITLQFNDFWANGNSRLVDFLISLAHELCHANQTKLNLKTTNDSFGNAFRLHKLSEIETMLLDIDIERQLLLRPEFRGMRHSLSTQVYLHQLVIHRKNKEQNAEALARADLIKAFWRKGFGFHFPSEMQQHIQDHYTNYNQQAFLHTQVDYNPRLITPSKTPVTGYNLPLSGCETETVYRTRMGVLDTIPAGYFLTDKNDYIHADTFDKGIDFLDKTGMRIQNLNLSFYQLLSKSSPVLELKTYQNDIETNKTFFYFEQQIPHPKLLNTQLIRSIFTANEENNLSNQCYLFALINTIKQNHIDVLKTLLNEYPAVVNAQTPDTRQTLLMIAIQYQNKEAVQHILKQNPSLTLSDKESKTILDYFHYLQSDSLKKQIKDRYDEQQLFHQSTTLQYHTDITAARQKALSLWMIYIRFAVDMNNMERLDGILSTHSDIINVQDEFEKQTPLMIALESKNETAVKHIMKFNPNLLLKDINNQTVLDYLHHIESKKLKNRITKFYHKQLNMAQKNIRRRSAFQQKHQSRERE